MNDLNGWFEPDFQRSNFRENELWYASRGNVIAWWPRCISSKEITKAGYDGKLKKIEEFTHFFFLIKGMNSSDSCVFISENLHDKTAPKQHVACIDKHITLWLKIHDIVNSSAVESFIELWTIKIKFLHTAMENI